MIIGLKRKQILVWLMLAAVLAAGFWLGWRYAAQGKKHLPPEFAEARRQGAFVAEKIVFLGHQSLAGLEQIGGLDQLGKYKQALRLVKMELERNKKARGEALLLSSHLGTMAAYLPEVEPARARAIATEALGHEVNLVNHLLQFHGLLLSLFDLLEQKFKGEFKGGDTRVNRLIADINDEIKAINNLNMKFNQLMVQFDNFYESVDKNGVDRN